MPNTYTELRRTVLGTATNTVTFDLTGISGYTDLELVADYTASAASNILGRFNGDTGSNYSWTYLDGNGTTATSGRGANQAIMNFGYSFGTNNRNNAIIKFMNYANTTTNKTVINRQNQPAGYVSATVNLWRNTNAVTSIEIFTNAGNFAVGSTFSLYGIANADQGAAKATGGIITEDANYWYHTFGASGAFIPKQTLSCEYLVIAGGGGGGDDTAGNSGGGGAGGLLHNIGGSPVSLSATSYPITVGAGGPGVVGSANGTQGVNSTFNSLTAVGGGYGARYTAGSPVPTGGNGGSGGGAGQQAGGVATAGGSPTTGQGFKGGDNAGISAAGGGGAGAAAANVASNIPSGGGIGLQFASVATATGTGDSGYYAGGGGGSAHSSYAISATNAGGLGGGGKGHFGATGAFSGLTNTGGGGGGGGENIGDGGNGGSGIVIVRYAK